MQHRRTAPSQRWAEQKQFIAARLRWVGTIQRWHIRARFQVSGTVATTIIGRYISRVGGLTYDNRAMAYVVAGETDATRAVTLDEARRIGALDTLDCAQVESVSRREPSPEVTRVIFQAVEGEHAVLLRYLGAGQGEWEEATVSPLHLMVDGDRLHVRGYCHETETFRQFALSRVLAARPAGKIACPCDEDWQNFEELTVAPNPEGEADPEAAGHEYQLVEGTRKIRVRRATRHMVEARLCGRITPPLVLAGSVGMEDVPNASKLCPE